MSSKIFACPVGCCNIEKIDISTSTKNIDNIEHRACFIWGKVISVSEKTFRLAK